MTLANRFRWYWRMSNRFESAQLRWTGTSGIALLRRTPVLLLETTGRRTGKQRRAPVSYWQEDGAYFIGGGAAGMTRVDWVANLRAHPRAAIRVRRRRIAVVARELKTEEDAKARATAFARWPGAAKYERSGRRIPYFRLDPGA